MLMAAAMSYECGEMRQEDVQRLRKLLERTGLPIGAKEVTADTALENMQIDKKVKSGRIRLVLLRGIGTSYVTADYSDTALRKTLTAHFG
jgi:3-dehydroquinate synthase